jgi:hypothetical protein
MFVSVEATPLPYKMMPAPSHALAMKIIVRCPSPVKRNARNDENHRSVVAIAPSNGEIRRRNDENHRSAAAAGGVRGWER